MFVWRVNRISEGDKGGRVAKSADDVGRSFRCIIHPEVGNGKERGKRRRRRGRQETKGAVGWPNLTMMWDAAIRTFGRDFFRVSVFLSDWRLNGLDVPFFAGASEL